jgi:hypothetical protein
VLDDPLAWASYRFHTRFPSSRGAVGAESRPVLVAVVKDQKLEPIALTGLSPIEQPLLVLRQPLSWQRELGGLSALEPSPDLVVMQAHPSLDVSSAQIACQEGNTYGVQMGTTWTFEGVGKDCVMYVQTVNGHLEARVEAGDRVSCEVSGCQVTGRSGEQP